MAEVIRLHIPACSVNVTAPQDLEIHPEHGQGDGRPADASKITTHLQLLVQHVVSLDGPSEAVRSAFPGACLSRAPY